MSMRFQNLEVEFQGSVATVWLNRPQVRNAMDEVVIAELTQCFKELQEWPGVRVIVLGGRGSAFCAGGDLNWMKRMAGFSPEQNQTDAIHLATMLRTIYTSRIPVIARVHGAAYAGGMGLAAACDVIVADPAAEFCLSEVRIGLSPATISPYVIRALGIQASRRFMLTGERIKAESAFRLGFVHELTEAGGLDEAVSRIAVALNAGSPQAISTTKDLVQQVGLGNIDDTLMYETAGIIARIRASSEGREGVSSFLEKRRPSWLVLEGGAV